MLNEKTRQVLKGFLFNPQVKFEYPVTAISTPNKSIIAFIDMEKLGEEDFNPFGIIKTDVLLSVIDTIDDPEITFTDTDVEIKNDRVSQKIRKSPTEIFITINKESLKMVKENFEKVLEINMDEGTLDDILKRAKILGHDTFIFKENKVLTGVQNGSELEDETETSIASEGNGEIILNINDLYKLPKLGYNFKVYTDGDVKLLIANPAIDGVEVVISEKLS